MKDGTGNKWYEKYGNIEEIQASVEELVELKIREEHTILCYDVEKQLVKKDSLCEGSGWDYQIKAITRSGSPQLFAVPIDSKVNASFLDSNEGFKASFLDYIEKRDNYSGKFNLEIELLKTDKDHRGKRLGSLLLVISMEAFKLNPQSNNVQLENQSMWKWFTEHPTQGSVDPKKCAGFFGGTKAYLIATRVAGFHSFLLEGLEWKSIVDGLAKIDKEIGKCKRDMEYNLQDQANTWSRDILFSPAHKYSSY
jgi:hypothetical protein